jgi:hypothetical protein
VWEFKLLQLRMFHLERRRAADFFCYDGVLSIGQVEIGVRIFLHHWDLQDYLNQWKEGVERIKTHDTSCLITGFEKATIIDGERYSPRLSWIVLYKKGNKVIAQKLSFFENVYDEYIGTDVIIDQNNCYNYIPEYSQYYPDSIDYPKVSWQLHEDEFGKNFAIKVIDETLDPQFYCPAATGLINIGQYEDIFKMNVSLWSIDDYKQQWKEGIARLKQYPSSCLITWIANPIDGLGRWLLYKRDDKIVFYYDYFYGADYSEEIGESILLTKENCYDFIPNEQTHLEKYRIKEWIVDLKEFDGLEIVWPTVRTPAQECCK